MRRTLLLVGVLVAVGLTAWGGASVARAIDDLSETRIGETRTPIPGQRDVTLEERKYVVYYEVDDGTVPDSSDTGPAIAIPPLELTIRRNGDGPPLPLEAYGSNFDVTSGGRAAQAWQTVEVPEEGRYRMSAEGAEGEPGDPAIVLGKPVGGRVLRLVAAIAMAIAGLLIGLAVLVVGIILHIQRNRDESGDTVA